MTRSTTRSTPLASLYDAKPPYTAVNPAPSSYYLANIVVETNRSLQLFSGGLTPDISTDWSQNGNAVKNTHLQRACSYNMGGCMGCHGGQGQGQGRTLATGDFSVILARGSVQKPEVPSRETTEGLAPVQRNRSVLQTR